MAHKGSDLSHFGIQLFWLSMLVTSKPLMSEAVLGRHPEKELYSSPSPQGGTRAALPVVQSLKLIAWIRAVLREERLVLRLDFFWQVITYSRQCLSKMGNFFICTQAVFKRIFASVA